MDAAWGSLDMFAELIKRAFSVGSTAQTNGALFTQRLWLALVLSCVPYLMQKLPGPHQHPEGPFQVSVHWTPLPTRFQSDPGAFVDCFPECLPKGQACF